MIQGIKKGFSLVELLVVIAIIGILAAVGITAYSGYTSSAKQKAALANHAQVAGLLNSEFAKCAAGAGNFIWGSSCASTAVAAEIVAHFSSIGLMNPYSRTNPQVSLAKNVAADAWLGTDEDETTVLGQTAVHCTGAGCTIATKQGPAAADDTYLAIGSY